MLRHLFVPAHIRLADTRHREELARARTLRPGEVEAVAPATEPPVITRMGYQLRDHYPGKRR